MCSDSLTARKSVCSSILRTSRKNSRHRASKVSVRHGNHSFTSIIAFALQCGHGGLSATASCCLKEEPQRNSRQDGTDLGTRHGALRDAARAWKKQRARFTVGVEPTSLHLGTFDTYLDKEIVLLRCDARRSFCINTKHCRFAGADTSLEADRLIRVAWPDKRLCLHQYIVDHLPTQLTRSQSTINGSTPVYDPGSSHGDSLARFSSLSL